MSAPPPRPGPSTLLAGVVLAVMVLITQAPGWLQEVIDPDESTFLLMGSDVARGNLPFVGMFDLKPPGIFVLFGLVEALAGKSLVLIRLLGDGLIALTALLAFLLGKRLANGWAALGGALLYCAFTALDLGQSTYTELPAMACVMGAVLALAGTPVPPRRAALAGALLALAVLFRTNLFVLPIALGMVLAVAAWRQSARVEPRAWLGFGLGGLAIVAALILPYAAAGELALLRLAMIDVPLAYTGQMGALAVVQETMLQVYHTAAAHPFIVIPFVVLALGGLILLAAMVRGGRDWTALLALVSLLAVSASLLIGGAVYPHYWLQPAPLLAIPAALALQWLGGRAAGQLAALPLVAIAVGAALLAQGLSFAALLANPGTGAGRSDVAQAAAFIRQSGGDQPQVWAWRYQLIGWYLDVPPLSKAGVQPENIDRAAIIGPLARAGYVSADELGRLMAMRPDFVVTDKAGKGTAWIGRGGTRPEAWLAAHYRLEARFGDVLVYRRQN